MSDRYYALTVILEAPIKDEDAAPIIEAIKQLRGVLSVQPQVSDAQTLFARQTARAELYVKLLRLLDE